MGTAPEIITFLAIIKPNLVPRFSLLMRLATSPVRRLIKLKLLQRVEAAIYNKATNDFSSYHEKSYSLFIDNRGSCSSLTGPYDPKPTSPIQALGVNPFPSRFIIRTVPRGGVSRRQWKLRANHNDAVTVLFYSLIVLAG